MSPVDPPPRTEAEEIAVLRASTLRALQQLAREAPSLATFLPPLDLESLRRVERLARETVEHLDRALLAAGLVRRDLARSQDLADGAVLDRAAALLVPR